MKNELLDIYYDLYDIFEDVELIADAIKDLSYTTQSRCNILRHLEFTRLWNLDSELNQLYDMQIKTLKLSRSFQYGTRITILVLATTLAVLHQINKANPNAHVFCPFGGLESLYQFLANGEVMSSQGFH